jgi:hypothetical protein
VGHGHEKKIGVGSKVKWFFRKTKILFVHYLTYEGLLYSSKVLFTPISPLSRKRESSLFKAFWTPASAGVTADAGFSATLLERNYPTTANSQKIDTTDSIWGQDLFVILVKTRKKQDILGIPAPAVWVKGLRTPFLFYLQSLLGIIANSPGVERKRGFFRLMAQAQVRRLPVDGYKFAFPVKEGSDDIIAHSFFHVFMADQKGPAPGHRDVGVLSGIGPGGMAS